MTTPRPDLVALRSDLNKMTMQAVGKPRKLKPELRIYWSKREKALLYDGRKETGGMLSYIFENIKIIDIYGQRHGLGAKLHTPDESDERTFAQELDARGYDLTTLKFSIRKKPGVET